MSQTESKYCWNNIGKRCYLINEANFLNQLASSNLCIRAICNDQSIYSCNVSLGSFRGTKDAIICNGIMKLYPLNKSLKNLHMHIAMRIFNVDHTHPTAFHRSILTVSRNTQTDCYRMNRKIQTGVIMRHAAVQRKKLKNKQMQVMEKTEEIATKEAAVQLSTRISQQQLTETISKIISQALANEKMRQSQKYSGRKLSITDKNLNRIKSDTLSGKTNNLLKKNEDHKKTKCQRLHMSKSTNLNGNHLKWNVERLCNKPRTTDIRNQYYENIINNPSNSYNAICRRQLLNKMDRLIAQKMITLREIHRIKSANLNDQSKNSKKKIERLCRTSDQSDRSYKRLVNMKLSANKNITNISMINDNLLLAKSENQNLAQKLDSDNKSNHNGNKNISYSISSSKITSPTATISDYTSHSIARKSIGKKKDLVTEMRRSSSYTTLESDLEISSNDRRRNFSRTTSENDLEASSNNDSYIKSNDNNNDNNNNNNNNITDNDNNTNSTARTVSSEFSSEASTVTEL